MVEVVGSRAGPPWSRPGSPATRVWREEDGRPACSWKRRRSRGEDEGVGAGQRNPPLSCVLPVKKKRGFGPFCEFSPFFFV